MVAPVTFEAEGRLGARATLLGSLLHGGSHFPVIGGGLVEIGVGAMGASDVRAAAGRCGAWVRSQGFGVSRIKERSTEQL